MHSETEIAIRAPAAYVYRIAASVDQWPTILPHYLSVQVLARRGNRRLVRMHASRDGFPCLWTAEQALYPAERRIFFKHVRGVNRGMTVWWMIAERDGGCAARLLLDLRLGWPWPFGWLGERVITHVFVEHIAGKTLTRIKALAEGSARPQMVQVAG